ncbi:MAG: hypothetical protein LBS92_02765 [Candidatus Methanoplasma sp.]|jgi:hypothetical protein|nr:hypothetical protein [Candidatus Methanoplasma sp.]
MVAFPASAVIAAPSLVRQGASSLFKLPRSFASCAKRVVIDRDVRPGDRSAAIAIVTACVVFLVATMLSSVDAGGEPDGAVMYYDGDVLVGVQAVNGDNAVLMDYAPEGGEGSTFFGWTSEPGKGPLHAAGSEMRVGKGINLYAAVCNGIIEVDGNVATFRLNGPPQHTSPFVIDLGYAVNVTSVVISEDTAAFVRATGSSVKVEFHNGFELLFDVVSSLQIFNGDVEIGYAYEAGEVIRLDVLSGGERLDRLEGGLNVAVDVSPVSSSETLVFRIDGGKAEEVPSAAFDGKAVFDLKSMLFKTVTLLPVNASVDGAAADLRQPPIGFHTVRSDYFDDRGMLSTGDMFSLGPAPDGKRFAVAGTQSVEGVFVVTGMSSVRIALTAGNVGAHSIILPETQIGYVLTSNAYGVDDGGKCILSYKLLPGYTDKDLAIAVNGNVYELNSIGEIHLNDVREDMFVTVSGVYDVRVYGISVPRNQEGYALSVSSSAVHHGQSYTVRFQLTSGYGGSPVVRIAGGQVIVISGGVAVVNDVRGDHQLVVEGVELLRYRVTAGSNTAVLVNGAPGDTATPFDIVSVYSTVPGYALPTTFEMHIPNGVIKIPQGYRLTSDTVFPSVIKIIVGENIICGGIREYGTIYICRDDNLAISPELGYSFPQNYESTLKSMNVDSIKIGGNVVYRFLTDTTLPSIYKVSYFGRLTEFTSLFLTSGDDVPLIEPPRDSYLFIRWDVDPVPINEDLEVHSIWELIWYKLMLPNAVDVRVYVNRNDRQDMYYYTNPRVLNISCADYVQFHGTLESLQELWSYPATYRNNLHLIGTNEHGDYYQLYGDCIYEP